jgi:alanine dehydrogenase
MRIGIPKEIKVLEGRVGLVPDAAGELVRHGHEVFIEQSAGVLSGFPDDAYQALGVTVLPDAKSVYDTAQLIVKVKEPQPPEVAMLRADQVLFSYLHLAAEPDLLKGLLAAGLTAVAFETVEEAGGQLPLLAPMSDIAGRIATQMGAHYLHRPQGGKGLLLGGVPAAPRGHVVVLGGGVAGGNAALLAAGMGAEVTVFDRSRDKLAAARTLGPNVTGLFPYAAQLKQSVIEADVLIGAVLVAGEKAPHLVDADTVRQMEPGSVVIDISVDQGGCIETTRPTTWEKPTFEWEGVIHYGVTNMPGAVPKTASQALSASLIRYVLTLADEGWAKHPALQAGINVQAGKVIHPGLQRSIQT